MCIGGPTRGLNLRRRRVWLTDPQIVGDRAVEEICILVDDSDLSPNSLEAEIAQIMTADFHRTLVRIVEAQQQTYDGGFTDTARPDETDPLTRGHFKIEPFMGGSLAAGISEAHVLEGHCRRHLDGRCSVLFLRHDCRRIEQMENRLRRGLRHHAVMHERAHITERFIYFHTKHQDHNQGGQIHAPIRDPERTERQCGRGTDRNPRICNTARQRVRRQHPHGGLEQLIRLGLQGFSARAALPERLQGRKALDGIQELRGKRPIGTGAPKTVVLIPRMEDLRCDQGDQGGGEHHQRHRHVEEHHDTENQQRREDRDDELRQILAEINL